jgi:antitoxin component HigA of HigAB toxin-antitoxin module
MDISPIKNQRDYRKVLKEIEGLMSAKHNTPEGDRLDVLVTLVEAWERKHYPMDIPDPVEAIKYHMDQNGLQSRDLIPSIRCRNRPPLKRDAITVATDLQADHPRAKCLEQHLGVGRIIAEIRQQSAHCNCSAGPCRPGSPPSSA